jgi:hypothetical protein
MEVLTVSRPVTVPRATTGRGGTGGSSLRHESERFGTVVVPTSKGAT